MSVINGAALDSGEGFAKLHGDLAGHAATNSEIAVVGFHLANGSDHGGGAAGKGFTHGTGKGVVTPGFGAHKLLGNGIPQVLGDLKEGCAGDPRKQ